MPDETVEYVLWESFPNDYNEFLVFDIEENKYLKIDFGK